MLLKCLSLLVTEQVVVSLLIKSRALADTTNTAGVLVDGLILCARARARTSLRTTSPVGAEACTPHIRESAKAHVAPSVFGFRVVSAYALAALSASAFALVDMSALEIYFNQSFVCCNPVVVD